jgi:hypothetical protein
MKTFCAILLYALSLFGIDVGGHVRIDRVRSNGTDVLYSKVVSQPTGTRFECLSSASGRCYYTVFVQECAAVAPAPGKAAACQLKPERFALAGGGSRQAPALPDLHLCVSTQARTTGRDCQ